MCKVFKTADSVDVAWNSHGSNEGLDHLGSKGWLLGRHHNMVGSYETPFYILVFPKNMFDKSTKLGKNLQTPIAFGRVFPGTLGVSCFFFGFLFGRCQQEARFFRSSRCWISSIQK